MTRRPGDTVKIIATFDQLKEYYGSNAQLFAGAEMVVVECAEGTGWQAVRGRVEGIWVSFYNDEVNKEYE